MLTNILLSLALKVRYLSNHFNNKLMQERDSIIIIANNKGKPNSYLFFHIYTLSNFIHIHAQRII